MKARLRDIAETLGVSISQVSRALANKNGVDPDIRGVILAEAKKRGYRNDSGKHKLEIAVVFRDVSATGILQLEELQRKLKRKNSRVVFLLPESCNFLESYQVDQVVALNLPRSDRMALQQKCNQLGLPVSALSTGDENEKIP